MKYRFLLIMTTGLLLLSFGCSNPIGETGSTTLSEIKALGEKIPDTISLDPTEVPASSGNPALYIEDLQEDVQFDFSELGLSFLDYIALPIESLKWCKNRISSWATPETNEVMTLNQELIPSIDLEALGLPQGSTFTLQKAKFSYVERKLILLLTLELNAGSPPEPPDGWVLSYKVNMTIDSDGSYELLADIHQSVGFDSDSYWYWIINNDETTGKTWMLDMSDTQYGNWFDLTVRKLNSANRYDIAIFNDDNSADDTSGGNILFLMNQISSVYLSDYLQDSVDNYSIKDIALYGSDYTFLGKTDSGNSAESFTSGSITYSVDNASADYFEDNWPDDFSDYRNSIDQEFTSILDTYFDEAVAGNLFGLDDFADF